MTPERAISTVQKLVRMAAPSSGASEAERTSAALHACQLIAEHELSIVVASKPEPPRERRGPRMSDIVDAVIRSTVTPVSRFRRAIAAHDATCGVETCHEPIFQGETVWRRIKDGEVEYVHADCWTY